MAEGSRAIQTGSNIEMPAIKPGPRNSERSFEERFLSASKGADLALSKEAQEQFKHLYVIPKGKDNASCNLEAPCKTIGRALDLATAGTTIDLAPGIYPETITLSKSGRPGAPITIRGSSTDKPSILDLKEKTCSADRNQYDIDAAIDLSRANHVVIDGLAIRNFKSSKPTCTPAAVAAIGSNTDVTVKNLEISNIEAAPLSTGQAHAIAIFGTGADAARATRNIKIEHNHVHDLKLGASEAIAINGNVEGFSVSHNRLSRLDNIAIDIIGAEGKAPDRVDLARKGQVIGNEIDLVDTANNPAYGGQQSAGGIYVDGGKNIEIAHNSVSRANYGISLGSEHAGKDTEAVWMHHNVIAHSHKAGLDLGGYDLKRGGVRNNTIENNRFIANDSKGSEEGQILLQNRAVNNLIRSNSFEKTRNCKIVADYGSENKGNRFENNSSDCR